MSPGKLTNATFSEKRKAYLYAREYIFHKFSLLQKLSINVYLPGFRVLGKVIEVDLEGISLSYAFISRMKIVKFAVEETSIRERKLFIVGVC